MNNIDRIRKGLSPARRRKIAARAATLIAEDRSLRELRRAHKLTQKKMAEVLGVGQDSVSRVEQRSDVPISMLRNYVEAMRGKLSLLQQRDEQLSTLRANVRAGFAELERGEGRDLDSQSTTKLAAAVKARGRQRLAQVE